MFTLAYLVEQSHEKISLYPRASSHVEPSVAYFIAQVYDTNPPQTLFGWVVLTISILLFFRSCLPSKPLGSRS